MNNRTLVILLFVGWSILCWRIYVCRIKQVCGPTQGFATTAAAVGAETRVTAPPVGAGDTLGATEGSPSDATATESAFTAAESDKSPNTGAGVQPNTNSKPAKAKPQKEAAPSPEPVASTSGALEEHVSIEETADEATIHFPYNSTRKVDNDEMDGYLSRLAKRLKGSSDKVLITGHTDGIGDAATNNDLALKRAQSIRGILIKKGVSAKHITCRSFGERKPVASDDTPAGRYKNRRAVLTVQ
jgi:outer membrane protein OmpA-like peptidoglycan-associated protein